MREPAKHAGQYSADKPPPHPGRPKGSLNRITRTMKDAVIAAAEELGQIDFDKWEEHLKGDPENGMKQFFKTLAVKELRTFGIILARIMPLHVQTNTMPAYLTEEQAIAELKMYGLPPDLIKHLHSIGEDELDKEDIGNPYGDPDVPDDEQMVEVTPKPEATE
jgi:hypothetical protein